MISKDCAVRKNSKVLGPRVEARRRKMGVSKQTVADMIGVTWGSANKKLLGQVDFTLSEAEVIADAWGISIDDLIGRSVPKFRIAEGGADDDEA